MLNWNKLVIIKSVTMKLNLRNKDKTINENKEKLRIFR